MADKLQLEDCKQEVDRRLEDISKDLSVKTGKLEEYEMQVDAYQRDVECLNSRIQQQNREIQHYRQQMRNREEEDISKV